MHVAGLMSPTTTNTAVVIPLAVVIAGALYVCKGEMSLADAQKCIASNWVQCWEKKSCLSTVGGGEPSRVVNRNA